MHLSRRFFSALSAAALLAALAGPLPAFAQVAPWVSFGGRVVSINFCLHGAVNINIVPAGGSPAFSYVWSLPPTTISVVPAPPVAIGQLVLGLALPVPVPCVGFGTHPPVWYGFQVIYGGASAPLPTGSSGPAGGFSSFLGV